MPISRIVIDHHEFAKAIIRHVCQKTVKDYGPMSSSLKTLHVLCLEAGRVLSTGDVLNDAIAIDNASRCNQEVAP